MGIPGNHGYTATLYTKRSGLQDVYVYAATPGGKYSLIAQTRVSIQADNENPRISNVKVTDIQPGGYRISCTVTDNGGVDHVDFPTWSAAGAQDDVVWHRGVKSGDTYYYDVKSSEHKGDTGSYYSHIYAYDMVGNGSSWQRDPHVLLPKAMVNANDATFFLYDETGLTWEEAEQRCESAYEGGQLASILNAEEEAVVEELMSSGDQPLYFIGASDSATEGTWIWPQGQELGDYRNWMDGEPNGGTSENYAAINKPEKKWLDLAGDPRSDTGYIARVEGLYEHNGTVTTDFPEGIYTINASADESYVADVTYESMESAANVTMHSANGGDNQRFKFTLNEDGTYTITAVHSGLALDVLYGRLVDESNVVQHAVNGSAAQRWYVEETEDGYYSLRSKVNNLYLDVYDGRYADNGNLQTYHANSGANQKFALNRADDAKMVDYEIYDITSSGYKMRLKLDAPVGLKYVECPTWTAEGGQDDLTWHQGVLDGDTLDYEVKASDHNGEKGVYRIHFYGTDRYDKRRSIAQFDNVIVPTAVMSWNDKTYYLVDTPLTWPDAQSCAHDQGYLKMKGSHLASIESAEEKAVLEELMAKGSATSYWIGASDAEKEGTWVWENGEPVGEFANWDSSTSEPNGGIDENYVSVGQSNGLWMDYPATSKKGFIVEVEGYDRLAPVASEVKTEAIDETGFSLSFKASDPSGVEEVKVMAWTEADGEDDLVEVEPTRQEDGVLYYRVETSAHGGAGGIYHVRAVARDACGNEGEMDLGAAAQVLVPDAVVDVGDAVYYRFDQPLTWTEASRYATESLGEGMQLASVLGDDDVDRIAELIADGTKSAYWIGLSDTEATGVFSWSDGSNLDYTRWASGQPNASETQHYAAVLASNLKWYAYTDAGVGSKTQNMGFITKMSYAVDDAAICDGDHEWGEWEQFEAASCSKAGLEIRYCNRCGDSESREIEKLAHTAGDSTQENEHAATCDAEGSYDLVTYCSVCGEEMSRSTESIAKLEHSWDEGAVTTAPTCEDAGVRTYTCKHCGSTKIDQIAATGHVPGNAVVENEASSDTCSHGGSFDEVVYCKVCGEELSRVKKTTPAGAHTPVSDPSVEPTCTETGLTEGSHCLVCGEVLSAQEVVPALGHQEVAVDAVQATCTDPGITAGLRCDRCGEVLSGIEQMPALGHDYHVVVIDPTCVAEGRTDHICSRCGDSYSDSSVPALGHVPGETVKENVVDPTCTQEGSHDSVVRCATCGEELSRIKITDSARGHVWGEGEVLVNPTCTNRGAQVLTCMLCGETKAEILLPTGHVHSSQVRENEVSAACSDAGSYDIVTCCDDCGTELSRLTISIAPLGHEYETSVVEPTWEEAGYTLHKCSRCGDEYQTDSVESLSDQAARERVDAAKAAIASLPSIGDLTIDDEDAVVKARAVYESLSDDQKALVDTSALESVEAKLVELQGTAKVDRASGAILALPDAASITLNDKTAVSAARLLFDALTTDQQSQLGTFALRILQSAENRIAALEKAAAEEAAKAYKMGNATVNVTNPTYSGKTLTPTVTVKMGSKKLVKGTDYAIAYKDKNGKSIKASAVKAVGSYKVVVTGAGSYSGSVEKAFKVVAAKLSSAKVTVSSPTYTGKTIAPTVTVKVGTATLKNGTDYTVAYKNSKGKAIKASAVKAAGSYKVVLTGKANYTGSVEKAFKVNQAKITAATFSKIATQTITKAGKAVTPGITVKYKGVTLKKGTDYTLAYKNNKKAGTATAVVKGKGSFTGSKSVNFKIVAKKAKKTASGLKAASIG